MRPVEKQTPATRAGYIIGQLLGILLLCFAGAILICFWLALLALAIRAVLAASGL